MEEEGKIKKKEEKEGSFIDKMSEKLISRKLLAWIVSCFLLVLGFVDGEQWLYLTTAYISVQGIYDIAKIWKG